MMIAVDAGTGHWDLFGPRGCEGVFVDFALMERGSRTT